MSTDYINFQKYCGYSGNDYFSGPDLDCEGVCYGLNQPDECGVCFGQGLNSSGCCGDLVQDCDGECGIISCNENYQEKCQEKYDFDVSESLCTAIEQNQYFSSSYAHSLLLDKNGNLIEWGNNSDFFPYNNLPVIEDYVKIDVSIGHTLVLSKSGQVYAFDRNDYGQSDVPENLSGVIDIAAGHQHSVALKLDGTLIAWGRNHCGQTEIPQDLTNVVAIDAGSHYNIALKSDGTITQWGCTGWVTSSSSTFPMEDPPQISNIVSISAG